VRTTIVHLLSADHIKELKKLNKWPKEFLTEGERKQAATLVEDNEDGYEDRSSQDSDNDDDLFVNPNHPLADSEEEDEEGDEDD